MQRKSERGQWRGWKMKRSENEGKVKERRSSGNNTLEYLKERNERIDEIRKQEERKNENIMKLMSQQLQQQRKQIEGFQTMMMTMFSKFLEKN